MYHPLKQRLMKRSLLTFWIALIATLTMQAQYVVSDKYDLWFEDTDYEMTTRKHNDAGWLDVDWFEITVDK